MFGDINLHHLLLYSAGAAAVAVVVHWFVRRFWLAVLVGVFVSSCINMAHGLVTHDLAVRPPDAAFWLPMWGTHGMVMTFPYCYAFRHFVPCHSSQEALQCRRFRFSRAGSLNLGLGGASPMQTSTRKRLGAVVMVILPLVALGLYAFGAPLLSLQELHSSSLPDGGVMVAGSFKLHWPLLMVCLFALIGLIAFSWPARKPPRLEP